MGEIRSCQLIISSVALQFRLFFFTFTLQKALLKLNLTEHSTNWIRKLFHMLHLKRKPNYNSVRRLWWHQFNNLFLGRTYRTALLQMPTTLSKTHRRFRNCVTRRCVLFNAKRFTNSSKRFRSSGLETTVTFECHGEVWNVYYCG